jgi:hypothetical protein
MATIIAKEDIPQYHIIPAFVDNTEFWKNELNYAARLGNEFKGKTSITFETKEGPITVTTTIWSVTENDIQLKGGMSIPLNSIIEVHF